MTTFDDVTHAIQEANIIIARSDRLLQTTADLLRNRLQSAAVSAYTLRVLKKELQDFNMRTGCWKDK